MWSNFDNSAQNEGGYMDSSVADGGQGADDKGNLRRGQNCVPTMITHLIRHGDKLNVWGSPVKMVTFVAIVRKLEALSTKVSFELQDETGVIKGIKWLEGDNAVYESPVQVNNYARVYGTMRDQNSEPYVFIISIQPLEHLNELLTHLMEVTVMCLEAEKRNSMGGESIANGTAQDTPMTNGYGGLTGAQQKILDIIKDSDPEYGAERDAIKSRVPREIVHKVDEIIEFLSAEGHIYTTKTDDFFKAI
ncbi:hypothetical protein QAD02_006447 [Eretmocerus hayati]|uniref:Uncharacterized protein n=1 Tax=Eretmocerus hayati TaxID=131215 RepID=A0ACC2N531_9HYME|nr:hypothetical protein QAD02_006447 [Eretmocerus hayati]